MSLPSVSVVIPVKDDAASLQRCLAALRGQSRPPLEIIVVDDGSADDSAAVARAGGARVVECIGSGIPAASATGYDASVGDVLARLDADCIPPVDWCEHIALEFAADDTLAGLTGFARFRDGPRALRGIGAFLYLAAYFATVTPALGHVPLFGSNLAVRRTAWLEVAGLVHRNDELMHDDMDLSMHLGPERCIRLDRDLRMGMSSRPFTRASGFGLRLHRGFHSIVAHWPAELPWKRWYRRIRSARRDSSGGESRISP